MPKRPSISQNDLNKIILDKHKNIVKNLVENLVNTKILTDTYVKIYNTLKQNPLYNFKPTLIKWFAGIWKSYSIRTTSEILQDIVFYNVKKVDKFLEYCYNIWLIKKINTDNKIKQKNMILQKFFWIEVEKSIYDKFINGEYYDTPNIIIYGLYNYYKNTAKIINIMQKIWIDIKSKDLEGSLSEQIDYIVEVLKNYQTKNNIDNKTLVHYFLASDQNLLQGIQNYLYFFIDKRWTTDSLLDYVTKIPDLQNKTLKTIVTEEFPYEDNLFDPKFWIIFLDEFIQTQPEVRYIYYRILNERQLDTRNIPTVIDIYAASNLLKELNDLENFDLPIFSRFASSYILGSDNRQATIDIIKDSVIKFINNINPIVADFLENYSDYILYVEEDEEFPIVLDPRKWTAVANSVNNYLVYNTDISLIISGHLGNKIWNLFLNFLEENINNYQDFISQIKMKYKIEELKTKIDVLDYVFYFRLYNLAKLLDEENININQLSVEQILTYYKKFEDKLDDLKILNTEYVNKNYNIKVTLLSSKDKPIIKNILKKKIWLNNEEIKLIENYVLDKYCNTNV